MAEDLLVSSAISLKEALLEIAHEYEVKHKGVHIVLNGASSGELALQIKKGAPVDRKTLMHWTGSAWWH